jgi:death on curing protein
MAWTWVDKNIVLAIHDEQIAEHGGETGMRDEGLLISAQARPLDKANYEDANVISLAAAYGYGIARNHPFLDGNKRTAFVTMELFLILNDWELKADDGPCLEIFIALADGSLSEKDLTKWLKANTQAGTP